MRERLIKQLIRHEGMVKKVYKCPAGKLTVGVGRNLEDKGLSEKESIYLLNNDIEDCELNLRQNCFFNIQDDVRREVLINMCFNLGYFGLLKFKNFIAAMEKKDYEKAAIEMMDSIWAKQVGNRAKELRDQILTGRYQK